MSTVAPVNDTHTYVCARVQESRGSSVQTQSGPQRRRKSFFTSAVHYYVISGCRRLQLGISPFHGEHHDGARRARFVEPSLEPRPCQPVHRAEQASAVRRVFEGWQGGARSRARVPSCQRQCPIHRRKRGKHAFQHLHLHGDGATIAPWCNHIESTATVRRPPRGG